jgi:hypothetical protein
MLVPRWGLSYFSFVAGSHPSSVSFLDKCFFVGFVVLKISENNGRGLDDKLPRLIAAFDNFTIRINELYPNSRK